MPKYTKKIPQFKFHTPYCTNSSGVERIIGKKGANMGTHCNQKKSEKEREREKKTSMGTENEREIANE